MAQKITVLLVDDIDGGRADETVSFSVDGASYEIDLSKAHADDMRAALAPWITRARKVSARGAARPKRAAAGNSDVARIRAWARATGRSVNERGRVPQTLREAYNAAH